jgi:hypothetical protein
MGEVKKFIYLIMLTDTGIWDNMGLCLLVLNPKDSSGPSNQRRNSMSSFRVTVYRRSVGSFGLVLLLAAILRCTKSIKIWMKKSPSLQDPGAQAPGQIKKEKSTKLQAPSFKLQAPSLTNTNNRIIKDI